MIRKSEDNRSDHQIFKRSVSTVDTNNDDDDVYDDDKAGFTEEEEEEVETGSVSCSCFKALLEPFKSKIFIQSNDQLNLV